MARIKKTGLDYFPLDTDFMQQRAVRRLMKQQGDCAFTVLLSALSAIYGGKGYYIHINDNFCEDLATELFDTDARKVKDVLMAAIELDLFDNRLYREYGILTSAHIQEQYLFCSKRRKRLGLDERYRLVTDGDPSDEEPAKPATEAAEAAATETANAATSPENVATTPQNVTTTPENVAAIPQSKAQQSKKKPLPHGSPETGGTPTDAGRTPSPGEEGEIHEIEYDEHIWTSPANCVTLARAAADGLIEADPANQAYYEENLERLTDQLEDLDSRSRQAAENGTRKKNNIRRQIPLPLSG